jgi:hypothetical protein
MLASAALGEQTLTFTRVQNPQDLQEITTAIRSIAGVSNARLNTEKKTLTIDGDANQIDLAGWLFSGLNIPASSTRYTIERSYTIPGDDRESAVRLYFLANTEPGKPLQDLAAKVRTATKIPRLFLLNGQRALVLRCSPDQMEQADQMIRELDRR